MSGQQKGPHCYLWWGSGVDLRLGVLGLGDLGRGGSANGKEVVALFGFVAKGALALTTSPARGALLGVGAAGIGLAGQVLFAEIFCH